MRHGYLRNSPTEPGADLARPEVGRPELQQRPAAPRRRQPHPPRPGGALCLTYSPYATPGQARGGDDAQGEATGIADTVARAPADLPADTDGAELWAALGRADVPRDLYAGAGPPRPDRLGTLLGAIDERADNGATLRVLVQTASALPLLRSCGSAVCAAAHEEALRGMAQIALAATDSAALGSDLLRGGKRWVTGLLGARHILVLARHRPGRHFTSFTWVRAPPERRRGAP